VTQQTIVTSALELNLGNLLGVPAAVALTNALKNCDNNFIQLFNQTSLTLGTQQSIQGALTLANTVAHAYATTIESSNSATAAWTFTLPINAGTNNYVLQTDGAGNTSWVAQTGSSSLTTNTTPISGASAGQLLYSDGTKLQAGPSSLTLGVQQTTLGSLTLANVAAGAYATTLVSSPSALSAWTLTLPPTAGTSGYVLKTDGSGNTSWTAVTATAGGSPGQLQLNNSGSLAGAANLTYSATGTILTVAGATKIGDGSSTLANNTLTVNNSTAGGKNRQFQIGNGNWYVGAVPYLRSLDAGTVFAFDIMPNTSAADCWIDICSTDITADSSNYETLDLKKKANGDGIIACTAAGSGTVRNLLLQVQGGLTAIGVGIEPQSTLDIAGNLAIGSYAGNNAAPTGGLLVSGAVGVGTPTITSGIAVDIQGIIASASHSGAGEFRAYASTNYVALRAEASGNFRAGLFISNGTAMFYRDGGTGDVYIDTGNSAYGLHLQTNTQDVIDISGAGGITFSKLATAGILQTSSAGAVSVNSTVNAASVAANFVADHRLTIIIGSTTYYLPVSTVAW